jgi:hypothetical protein
MRSAMKTKRLGLLTALTCSFVLLLASVSSAATDPVWRIDSLSNSTAEAGGAHRYLLQLANVGDSEANGTGGDPVKLDLSLPPQMAVKSIDLVIPGFGSFPASMFGWNCVGDGPGGPPGFEGAHEVTCEFAAAVEAHKTSFPTVITTDVAPGATGAPVAKFALSGAEVDNLATTADETRIAPEASFGIESFDVETTGKAGKAFTQAAGHPFAYSTTIDFNSETNPRVGNPGIPFSQDAYPVEPVQDVVVDLPPGLVGNPAAVAECTAGLLANARCPVDAQVGTVLIRVNAAVSLSFFGPIPVYNMEPPPGAPAQLAFNALGNIVALKAKLRSESDYGLSIVVPKISQGLDVVGNTLTIWGNPADSVHDFERRCGEEAEGKPGPEYVGDRTPGCASSASDFAFLRMPTSCTAAGEGLPWSVAIDSWHNPGDFLSPGIPDLGDSAWDSASIEGHEAPGYPLSPSEWGATKGTEECEGVPVKGALAAQPTTLDTQTSSGLTVKVAVPNPGLNNPDGVASSDIKKVKVILPEGMTINPSQADGLGTCTKAQFESSELSFHPDGTKGCPASSKIGSVEVKTPLLDEVIPGGVYVAQPYDNPFGSLLALYVVMEEPERGVLIKLTGEVKTNPTTGQITTTFDDLPQQPFSSFDFRFREGARAPLATPAACGSYETVAEFTGHSNPDGPPLLSRSSFDITRGIGGGPCPSGGLPPFKPGLIAGSLNNAAGQYSPFNVRLFRTDAEQEFTNFSIKLPPGISGKLAGVPFCPDAAIEAAKARTGAQELASPSCPAASEVGRTLAGAGVGSVLTYAPGKIYLAGPYNGSALSIASVTAAKVGPFDLGTVVVRLALRVDPETAEVFVDATGSDPIPHIIDGITVHLRDIRAYVDKPEFALNPTSCNRTSTSSTLLGSGLDFSSAADDRPVTVSTPYQAADCAALAFKPDLKISLKGGTKRGGHPALTAVLKMNGKQANIARAQVTLPRSEFLDQSHIGTVCTRVQYAKDQCPAKSVYGYARAFTPLLDEPLAGPVYLRSSEHKLPDMVVGLKSGKIELDVVGRIDSLDGRIRSTFETVPDAPVSKFVLSMQGGKKGLLENSTNLCARPNRAIVEFDAHNGKIKDSNPAVRPDCAKKSKKRKAKR